MKNKIIGIFVCILLIATRFSFDVLAKQNNPPDKPSRPRGEISGRVGVSYVYESEAHDPDGDQIYYAFDWGDHTNTGWIGPFDSDSTFKESHIWTSSGTYNIRVKVKDTSNAESPLSEPLIVTIRSTFAEKTKSIYIGLIKEKVNEIYGNLFFRCILVLHIDIRKSHIEKIEILRKGAPSENVFNKQKIGIFIVPIICCIFFS
jgi:hypothetical protein